MLNPIQNQGLRLALGAFRTSPETSLHAEAFVLPLELRRKQLTLQYATKISATTDNPVHNCLFDTPNNVIHKLENIQNPIKPISLRIQSDLKEINFNQTQTQQIKYQNTPFWELSNPTIDLDLTKFQKESTTKSKFRKEFHNLIRT